MSVSPDALSTRGMMALGSDEWIALVIEGAGLLGLRIERAQAEAFAVHAHEMIQWNRVTNLTAITRPRQIAIKHFVDALAPAAQIPEKARLLDLGSGAGFPGIPLKIIRPSLQVTLADSSRKRISFLKHALRKLGLEGIEAIHCRAENLASRNGMAAGFDVVICRALTDLPTFVGMVLPLLSVGGVGMALRGKTAGAEVREAQRHLTGRDRQVVFAQKAYKLPLSDSERVLVTFGRPVAAALRLR